MTSQEVRALIDAKIKGQGTNVDAGSVLPAILNGILDLIDSGGGGGTSDAVQYIPQELTSPQQMQARKNQGLYYSEGGSGDVILTWDGDTTGLESVDVGQEVVMYKVSDDAPQKELVKSLGMTVGGVEQIINIPQQSIITIEGGYGLGDAYIIVATESEASLESYTFTKGIWFVKGTTGNYVSKFTYGATETVHHIEPKYIKDMYYEEEGIKTINYDINGDREGNYTKVSDEVIEASAVIGHKFTSNNDYTTTDYTITEDMVIAADDTHPTRILYDASDPNSWAILIFPDDMEFESYSFSKGVWFKDVGTMSHPNYVESLEYDGVIVHQIPAKYVPQTIPVVRIEVPSNDNRVSYGIGYVLLNNYVSERDVVFSIEGKTIEQVAVRNMLDTTSTGDVWDFATGNTYTFDTSGYYLVEITTDSGLYYATVFVETVNQ